MTSAPSREWTKDETAQFIYRIETLPELWDASSDLYKDRYRRTRAIAALASEFNTDCREVSRKMHNLRTQLNAELRKIKKRRKKSGADVDDDSIRSSWQFFETLRFMIPFCKSDDSAPCYLTPENPESDSNTQDSNEEHSSQQIVQTSYSPLPKRRHTGTRSDTVLDTALQILQTKDDDQIFGDFVTSVLRNINNPQLKQNLKLTIQRAVLEAQEMDLANSYA
ncbi:hypothetical protein LSTR_LSTR013692 [Laodelphax striatellus]|uniref:MADF domain-containing protein n=1 Tax=Laodelphax striatellus TaxID=195883 RepID=A0A482WJW0_LAOST|nr:hypothetical protein LSTR_LSTR013692 [Laodelphax striatellus]